MCHAYVISLSLSSFVFNVSKLIRHDLITMVRHETHVHLYCLFVLPEYKNCKKKVTL